VKSYSDIVQSRLAQFYVAELEYQNKYETDVRKREEGEDNTHDQLALR